MSLIFKDEEQPIVPSTEQPKPEVKATGLPIQSAPVQGVTPPTVTGVPDEKFVEMLEKVITENNVPGLDYVELKQALDNMRALALDEPFSALDIKNRNELQNVLLTLFNNPNIDVTFILVTHDIREAVYLSNRLYIMKTNPGEIAKEFNINLGRNREQSIKYTPEYINYVQQVEQAFNSIG